ncbi:MAG: hypothetical protein M3144_05405 [Actinomycetota bacterium]|nr:hypothetical protein [Actinomycetota bacterium]
MHSGHRAVELVIETATGLLTGRFGPREAVTILASQGPQARAEARALAEREPDWSRTHAELLGAIRDALAANPDLAAQARDLRAVLEDLDRVVTALTT